MCIASSLGTNLPHCPSNASRILGRLEAAVTEVVGCNAMNGFRFRRASCVLLSCAAALFANCKSAEEKVREAVRAVAADSRLTDQAALERMARLVFADDAQTRYEIAALTPPGGPNRLVVFGHESANLHVEHTRKSLRITVYQVVDGSPRQNRPVDMLDLGRARHLEEILYTDVFVADVGGKDVTIVHPYRVRVLDERRSQALDGWEDGDLSRLPPHDLVMNREGSIKLSPENLKTLPFTP
jgi:hypothetical protein